MEIAFLLIGLSVGSIASWFIAKSKFQGPAGVSFDEYAKLDKDKAVLESQAGILNTANIKLTVDLEEATKALNLANIRIERAQEAFIRMKAENEDKLIREKAHFDERIANQKEEIAQLQKKLTTEFENIANRILDEKTQKFTDQNRTNLGILLDPLKEKLKSFEEKVDLTYKTDSAERITLKAEIKSLIEMNKQISDEANNLARALKGDNKKQGNWGEIILEKILERSGLVKGQEYRTQVNTTNDEGKRIQPDVIISLPDNKHIIVDSKVSLLAYEAYSSTENDEQREAYKKEHLRSIRDHVKGLSEKSYQSSADFNTPDFVLLFIPIESSFSVAVQADQELFSYAWDRKIVIVSPSTLLASLRTIASLWKQERQTRNALDIAKEGGNLYDKFVGFIEDMNDIGVKLDASKKSFSDAMNKLSTGTGNLVKRIQNLKELGAKANKSIPEKFLESTSVQAELLDE